MTTDWRYIRDTVRTDIDAGHEDFGMHDRFGRAIGCRWYLRHCTVNWLTDEQSAAKQAQGDACWLRPADALTDYVELDTQPTRNGERYGASTPRREFATQQEAREALAKHLVKARKYNLRVNARAPVPA